MITFEYSFKPGEINFDSLLFKYSPNLNLKEEKYGNFKELDYTKCKIDLLDKNSEKYRRAAAKYLHEYELVKLICKKNVISRAYFKLYEMVYYEPIIYSENLNCFFICEAPGGFIECITDIRRKRNMLTNYTSISSDNIQYDNYLDNDSLMYGDITNTELIEQLIIKIKNKNPHGLEFITADGGFDIKLFNSQEIVSGKLLLCEIYLALSLQKPGGMFIIKFFDMFTHNSIILYLILCSCYKNVKITKPLTSRNSNSERYIVCKNFVKVDELLLQKLMTIIKNHKENIIIFPDFNFGNNIHFLKSISTFNNLILYEQVKTINESIKMVNNKDMYIQNLLLQLFLDKKSILKYKHILTSRIKKCTNWLKNYNLNITHFLFV